MYNHYYYYYLIFQFVENAKTKSLFFYKIIATTLKHCYDTVYVELQRIKHNKLIAFKIQFEAEFKSILSIFKVFTDLCKM